LQEEDKQFILFLHQFLLFC